LWAPNGLAPHQFLLNCGTLAALGAFVPLNAACPEGAARCPESQAAAGEEGAEPIDECDRSTRCVLKAVWKTAAVRQKAARKNKRWFVETIRYEIGITNIPVGLPV
jgi:hypothetical protein